MHDGHVAVDGYLVGLIGGWMLYNHIQKGKVRLAAFFFFTNTKSIKNS